MERTHTRTLSAPRSPVVDTNGKPVARYHLENAWPAKWELPQLKASGNEVAIESIELVHEGLSLMDDDR